MFKRLGLVRIFLSLWNKSFVAFIWSKYSKYCEILLQFEINVFYLKIEFIPVIKAEYSASLLQTSVSHDLLKSLNMLICCSITFKYLYIQIIFLIEVNIFVETVIHYFHHSLMKGKLYLKQIFFNITNVFTITFDQFNASFLNKSINLFQNILLTVNFWMIVYIISII